ncbi:hypothetical protein HMPREF1979_00760 [Actinomyces johnsonii F0542]|uniref:Uncharacterized protein n=1 Tax=Actinomyces johnsonii F0542 TaxID=1321818 RepID=U1QBC9_9ACTO|nr:hypothetical protein HMPREF1979_00760 [Actinomyces johnsonii F0542]
MLRSNHADATLTTSAGPRRCDLSVMSALARNRPSRPPPGPNSSAGIPIDVSIDMSPSPLRLPGIIRQAPLFATLCR